MTQLPSQIKFQNVLQKGEIIAQISIKSKLLMSEEFYRKYLRDSHRRYQYEDRRGKRRPNKQKKKNADIERFIDPKDFSQVYQNPLANLFPLIEYFTGLEVEKQSKDMFMEQQYHRMMMRDMRRERQRRMRDDYSDQQYQKSVIKKNPFSTLISQYRMKSINTFQGYKKDVESRFNKDKDSMNNNRKSNLNFIQNTLHADLKGIKLLDQQQIDQKWMKIKGIISKKLKEMDNNFEKNRILLKQVRYYDNFVREVLNTKNEIKTFKNIGLNYQILFYNLIICYFTIPNEQILHSEIANFSQKSNSIFKKVEDDEQNLRRVIISLPYKESSFYWGKILQCCRNISEVDHYSYLTGRGRVQNFQAEYGGLITQQILKKLCVDQWLENSITSTIIEYLKNVQGANNYHNDDNFKACIFTHSETSIFINSIRDVDNKYLSYEKLIFLVNHENVHWFVITAYLNTGQLVVYNSLPGQQKEYCEKINLRLKTLSKKKRGGADFQLKVESSDVSPRQTNTSDCGVFAIINMICAFDKQKKQQRRNKYEVDIINQIRNSLLLFLLYLGYCKRQQVVPRKDYFDVLFRSTIHYNMRSKLHEQKR